MQISDFDYYLPPELIAQEPPRDRADARMMVVNRRDGKIDHRLFRQIAEFLAPGDLLVLNDTRVIPARLYGRKPTGGRVEVLLIEELQPFRWAAFYHASGTPKPDTTFDLAGGRIRGRIAEVHPGGRVVLDLAASQPIPAILEEQGVPPLPPYIRRKPGSADFQRLTGMDRERYQTVYARNPGAVAAPTAGLHFTKELLSALARQGVRQTAVTLHVGPGTFKPVTVDAVEDHVMEAERYRVGEEAAGAVNAAKESRCRVIAVGTTSVRVLESAVNAEGRLAVGEGRTSLFIHPPFQFRIVDGLLTNFHLPRSTLLMLVSAFAGRDLVRRAYGEGVARRYRFYSYGDCMLIV